MPRINIPTTPGATFIRDENGGGFGKYVITYGVVGSEPVRGHEHLTRVFTRIVRCEPPGGFTRSPGQRVEWIV